MIDLGIVKFIKKNLSNSFFNNVKFVGMDQITLKNCNKSSWMQVNQICLTRDRPEQFPSFFVRGFQRKQTTMRWSRVSKAYHFLNISANCADSMLFHCFYDSWNFVSKYFQNALICSNFAIIEAIMAGTYSLEWFLKKTPSTEKQKCNVNVMASFRCHGDSDCNKTQVIRNFHLSIIQLW